MGNKKLIAIATTIIIVITVLVGVYLMQQNNANSSALGTLNFKVGDYANYTFKTYENGVVKATYPITWNVVNGDLNGTACIVLEIKTDMQNTNSTTTNIVYWYMDKDTYDGLWTKTETYVDGVFVSKVESEFSGKPAFVDPQTIVSQEKITVPAGTFDCSKSVIADYGNTGETANEWYSASVPIGNLVKIETYKGAELTTVRELVAYSK